MAATVKKMKPKKGRYIEPDKRVIIAVVGVVCLAMVLTVFFVVNSGKDKKPGKQISAQTTSPGSTGPSGSAPAPISTVEIEDVLVPPLSIYRQRNPFKPLVNMEAATTATPTGTGASAVVVVPPELDPQAPNSVISRAVTLESVWEQDGKLFARIRVGEGIFDKVAVGDTFADNYKLLSLGKDSSATILYGDERFTVFVGQSIYW